MIAHVLACAPARAAAMTRRLLDFEALTFDCYGTLIDWETGIWDALLPLLMANGRADITRSRALATYGEREHAQESATPQMPYPQVL